MKVRLIWIGKTKEPFIRDGIAKYTKLLGRYAEVSITELRDEKSTVPERMVDKESERIESLGVPYILLDERGRMMDSREFAKFLDTQKPNPVFVMGGAFGVNEAVRGKARHVVSLSALTYPHELARVILLEQLYRACSILENRGYHH